MGTLRVAAYVGDMKLTVPTRCCDDHTDLMTLHNINYVSWLAFPAWPCNCIWSGQSLAWLYITILAN